MQNNTMCDYRLRPIRDLHWALTAPSLFTSLPEPNHTDIDRCWVDNGLENWLEALDKQPQALLEHLSKQRSTRLGIYFEQLLSFYFSNYPRFELIANNLQVNSANKTLGEFDFIVLDTQCKSYYHIEAAVKYYVNRKSSLPIKGNQVVHDWHQWIGPNQRDSLGIKMRHLLERQLQLHHTPEGKQALERLGISAINNKLLLKGRLYRHITDQKNSSPCYSSYPQPYYSVWLYPSEIDQSTGESLFVILPRQLWMAKITHNDLNHFSLSCLSKKELIHWAFTKAQHEHHVAELHKDSQNSLYEAQRFFILPQEIAASR